MSELAEKSQLLPEERSADLETRLPLRPIGASAQAMVDESGHQANLAE